MSFAKGINVPTPDLLIDAMALHSNFTVVTHNTQDFVHIPDLRIQDWLA